jgi:hypothetical protein
MGISTATDFGAVCFTQRFGSSLNLNIHFHALVLDGLYLEDASGVRFQSLPPPEPEELVQVVGRIRRRVERLLVRAGLCEDSVEPDDALVLFAAHASRRAAYGIRAGHRPRRPSSAHCAEDGWFSLHAGVVVSSPEALERLCRYVSRPALSHDRLHERPDGTVILRLKTPWFDGTTHLAMTGMELLAKLAVLVPPPRFHLVTYHGVLAPASPLRRSVVPEASTEKCGHAAPHATYIRWAELLQRTFGTDATKCSVCGGKLRVRAVVRGAWVAPKLLGVLHRPLVDLQSARDGPMQGAFDWS